MPVALMTGRSFGRAARARWAAARSATAAGDIPPSAAAPAPRPRRNSARTARTAATPAWPSRSRAARAASSPGGRAATMTDAATFVRRLFGTPGSPTTTGTDLLDQAAAAHADLLARAGLDQPLAPLRAYLGGRAP